MPVYDKLEKFAQRACDLLGGTLVTAPSPKGRKFVCYSDRGTLDITLSESIENIHVDVSFVSDRTVSTANLLLPKTGEVDVCEMPGDVSLRAGEGSISISGHSLFLFNVSTKGSTTVYTSSLVRFT